MAKDNITLKINKLTGNYEIIHNGFSWVSDGRLPYIILRKKLGKKYVSTYRPLYSALHKSHEISPKKIVTRLNGYVAFGKLLPFTLILTAEVKADNTVTFSVKAENETDYSISAVYFPAPFNAKKKDGDSYHVDAMRQGCIIPDKQKNLKTTFVYTKYARKINTGDCYMPIWGRVCGEKGFTAIVETPFDACIHSAFGKNRAFLNSAKWLSSLGKLSYERRLMFIFHSKMDYNTCAKDYRQYLLDRGQLLTLKDKIAENPNIEKLVGSAVLHHKIFSKIQPKSQFYSKTGTNELLCATFEQRAKEMEKIKSLGLDKLYIHTDGWGKLGYDNNHPYILPPCEKAGGWEGFKTLADTCRSLGYVFALHDQYRDYYYTSPVFDMEKAVTEIDGSHPYCSIWDGGEHTFLCASQALDFVKKTYTELDEHGIDVQGVYLDVFSVMNGDECFHPNHTCTREESINHRAACFAYLNGKGMIMSSEEPAMQLLNSLALVHHGPHALIPQVNGEAVGIPVPLGNLVYHDCVMVPWNWWNNWGIPKGENGDLYCALNAGLPYFHPYIQKDVKMGTDARSADSELKSDSELKKEISRIKPLSALQARLYDKEMIKHEFLGCREKQKTTFSDGTSVIIDLAKNTYEII